MQILAKQQASVSDAKLCCSAALVNALEQSLVLNFRNNFAKS